MTKLRHDGGEKKFTDKIDNLILAVSSSLTKEDKENAINERDQYFQSNGYVVRRVDNRGRAIVTYAISDVLFGSDLNSSDDLIYSLLIILEEEEYDIEEFCKKGNELIHLKKLMTNNSIMS